jgi:hypothetical protein
MPRNSGKSTMAIKEYMKDPENNVILFFEQSKYYFINKILWKFPNT